MVFSDERIEDFINSWERAYQERLTPEIARLEAGKLMDFMQLVLQPLSPEQRAVVDEFKSRTDSPRPRRG